MNDEQYTSDYLPLPKCSCKRCQELRECNAGERPLLTKGRLIRWMVRRDFPQVLEIEQLAFPGPPWSCPPWSEKTFVDALRERNTIGMVCETPHRESLDGYVIYELHKTHLLIVNLAVHPSCWRRGVGRALVEKLKGKLSRERRCELRVGVLERNLGAQMFFKELGFRGRVGEERYEFTYAVKSEIGGRK